MIFLGIDPGTTRIGYGVVSYDKNVFSCITYGIVSNPGKDQSADLVTTADQLRALILEYKPVAAGVEKLFFEKNQKTAMRVGEMRGVILLVLAQCGIPVHEPTPLEVKRSISGYGSADKRQVQRMVQLILKHPTPITPDDAADALAIAITCATSR